MFNAMISLFQTNTPRAIAILIAMIIVFCLLLWVSVIDIKKQSITFWKMLIASSSVIICPFIVSLFYTCEKLGGMKWSIIFAIPIWFLFLFINIKKNKDKFMGKADIDLLSAIFSVGICYSYWLSTVLEAEVVIIRITAFWYKILGFLLAGALIYLIIFVFLIFTRVISKRQTIKGLMKNTKISVIPMFMPAAVMVTFMILMS